MPAAKSTPASNKTSCGDKSETLLFEIGCEEIPPRLVPLLGSSLASNLLARLHQAALTTATSEEISWYATPRRLAVSIPAVIKQQPDRSVERKGPALAAAFNQAGEPTRAAEGFARSCGVEVKALEQIATPKGSWLIYRQEESGKEAKTLIPDCLSDALSALPLPKKMRWGDSAIEFIRPVQWILLLHGKKVIETEMLGLKTGRLTRGHRFHAPGEISLKEASQYESRLLDEGKVIAGFEARRSEIERQVERLAVEGGGQAHNQDALLDEVTGLVEWPHGLLGQIDKEFMTIPAEALISAMRDHQKYFHLRDPKGGLIPAFITISNIDSKNPKEVKAGNERVLRARLSDARFFWETDKLTRLEQQSKRLGGITFHHRLGTVMEKCQRLEQISVETSHLFGADPALAQRAAQLAKADLVTEMVGEFPQLQGVMGRYYALNDGEPERVAAAIEGHYRPRFAGDDLPNNPEGRAVATADKIDTLVGVFAADEEPSGDRDPYGLRRAALGVLRILIEERVNADLSELVEQAVKAYQTHPITSGKPVKPDSETAERVISFTLERLRPYYLDRGASSDVLLAVFAVNPTRPIDFDRRLQAVTQFREMPEAQSLAAANKRIRNILRKANFSNDAPADEALFTDQAEKKLSQEMALITQTVTPLLEEGDYTSAMKHLASLKEPVDLFFDQVMVMADDSGLRNNRLCLLQALSRLFIQVADISKLQN